MRGSKMKLLLREKYKKLEDAEIVALITAPEKHVRLLVQEGFIPFFSQKEGGTDRKRNHNHLYR